MRLIDVNALSKRFIPKQAYFTDAILEKIDNATTVLWWNLITQDENGMLHGLPGDDGQYLMTDGKNIWIDDYTDGVEDGISLDSGRDIREIRAWMYLPELPKEDNK